MVAFKLIVINFLVRWYISLFRGSRTRWLFNFQILTPFTLVIRILVCNLKLCLECALHYLIILRTNVSFAEFFLNLLFLSDLFFVISFPLLLFVSSNWCFFLSFFFIFPWVRSIILLCDFNPLRWFAITLIIGLGNTCKCGLFLPFELCITARFGCIFGLFLSLFVIVEARLTLFLFNKT